MAQESTDYSGLVKVASGEKELKVGLTEEQLYQIAAVIFIAMFFAMMASLIIQKEIYG